MTIRRRAVTDIKGPYELSIKNGVLHLNTIEGCILRIHGIPKDIEVSHQVGNGKVQAGMLGT